MTRLKSQPMLLRSAVLALVLLSLGAYAHSACRDLDVARRGFAVAVQETQQR